MTTNYLRFVFPMLTLITAIGLGSAQNQPQTVKRPPPAKATVAAKLAVPDLVAMNLTVDQASMQREGDVFSFAFRVTVRNIGTGNVQNPFYLSFQTYDEIQKRWGGERAERNCNRITVRLSPNQQFALNGTLKLLNFEISGKTLRLRALVDSGCSEEFPPAHGHIKELKEDNNFSNEVTMTGGYSPSVAAVHPNICARGDEAYLAGNSFGSAADSHIVKLRSGSHQAIAPVKSWHQGVIYFIVPQSAQTGLNKVSIADRNTMGRLSKEVDLRVCDTRKLAWEQIILAWDLLLKENVAIKLNTHGGGARYQNTSTIKLLEERRIDVPLIQFDKAGLDYRVLIKDMQSVRGQVSLTRQECNPNQLRLVIPFESGGVELKTYNRAKVRGANWCDNCLSDINVNNGEMQVIFSFRPNAGQLDFDIETQFSARVNASNPVADFFMDLFLRDWDGRVKRQVVDGVRRGLMQPTNKTYLASELNKLVKTLLGISQRTITSIEFKGDGIYFTYY